MNLIIDIGNTQAKLVAFDNGQPVEEVRTSNVTLADLPSFITSHHFDKGTVASVVNLPQEAKSRLKEIPFPMIDLSDGLTSEMAKRLDMHPEMGIDRVAAIVEAKGQMPGQNILIIDAGTCITYEFIAADGRYLGGNISPGVRLRFEMMHQMTSRLPLVSPEGDIPDVGYDTPTAMRSGVMLGVRHEIDGYIRRTLNQHPSAHIFLTGGNIADINEDFHKSITIDKYLVPRGLNRILEEQ